MFRLWVNSPIKLVATAMQTQAFSVLLIEFLSELRHFQKFFNINDCAEGILFKAILPVNDILSDFVVAEKIYKTDYPNSIGEKVKINHLTSMFIYFFIACPGLWFSFTTWDSLQTESAAPDAKE